MSPKGKGKMAREDEPEPVASNPDYDISFDLYDMEDDWWEQTPTLAAWTEANKGESSAVGGPQEQPQAPEQPAQREAFSSPLSAPASRTPSPPPEYNDPNDQFLDRYTGRPPLFTTGPQPYWPTGSTYFGQPVESCAPVDTLEGVARQIMGGRTGYVPHKHEKDPRTLVVEEPVRIAPGTERKLAPLKGSKGKKKQQGAAPSKPLEPAVLPAMTLPPLQPSQQEVIHEATQLPAQLVEDEAGVNTVGMGSTVAADMGKRLPDLSTTVSDPNYEFILQTMVKETELDARAQLAELRLSQLQEECARASTAFAAMRERAEVAEALTRRMFQEGTENVARFNKEIAELSAGLRNAEADQNRIHDLQAALEVVEKEKASADQRILAAEAFHANLLQAVQSQLAERVNQLNAMGDREQEVETEWKAKMGDLKEELEGKNVAAGELEAQISLLETDKTKSEQLLALAQQRVTSVTELAEREKLEHDRAVQHLQSQLDKAVVERRVHSHESSQLRDRINHDVVALAKVENDLVAARQEAAHWKEAANSTTTELRSHTTSDDQTEQEVAKLKLQLLQLTAERDAAVADKNRTEETVEQLQEKVKTIQKDVKDHSGLRRSLVRSQKLAADLQSQLEVQLRDPRLAAPPPVLPATTKSTAPNVNSALARRQARIVGRANAITKANLARAADEQDNLPPQLPRPDHQLPRADPLLPAGLLKHYRVSSLQAPFNPRPTSMRRPYHENPFPNGADTAKPASAQVATTSFPASEVADKQTEPTEDEEVLSRSPSPVMPGAFPMSPPRQSRKSSYEASGPQDPLAPSDQRSTVKRVFDFVAGGKSNPEGKETGRSYVPMTPIRPISTPKVKPEVKVIVKTKEVIKEVVKIKEVIKEVVKIQEVVRVKEVIKIQDNTKIVYVLSERHNPFRCWTQVYFDLWNLVILWLTLHFHGEPAIDTDTISSSSVAGPQASSETTSFSVAGDQDSPFATLALSVAGPQASPMATLALSVASHQASYVAALSSSVAGPQASSVVSSSVAGPQASSVVTPYPSVAGPQASSVVLYTPSVAGPQASSVVLYTPSVAGHQASSVVSDSSAQEASSPAASSSVVGPQASSVVSPSVAGPQASSVVLYSAAGHPTASSVTPSSVVGPQASSVETASPEPVIEISSTEALERSKALCPAFGVSLSWLFIHFSLFAVVLLCIFGYLAICKERAIWSAANDATRELYMHYYGGENRWGLLHHYFGELRNLAYWKFFLHHFLDANVSFPG